MEPKNKSLLREMRVKAGIAQKDLAKRTGIAVATICSIEYDKYLMSELMARRLGEFFGVDWKIFMAL
jgi:DNA-binding XRE family transcriptional regulator